MKIILSCCVQFSPAEINRYLGRSKAAAEEDEVTLEEVVKEVTARQVEEWPSKGTIPSSIKLVLQIGPPPVIFLVYLLAWLTFYMLWEPSLR